MLVAIIIIIILGVISGYFIIPTSSLEYLDLISTISLSILLLGVGIDIGRNKEVIADLKRLGFKIMLVPTLIAIGSIAGAILFGILIKLPVNESSAIAAGFGWYSLSAVILTKTYSTDIGALAFLSNVFRELFALVLIPLLAKIGTKLTVIAPGGATTMDTTLPLITKSVNDAEIAIIAFVSGAVLSAFVPILVPLLI
ncbi:lysine exporter LysO-like protein [Orenia metallireducens]|uniref:Lysine exporter LysO family protein n=1 Tax=Orenia metallireducens TaxID=1413210 RepID=A0A285GVF6_9FIRM|nr:lysine exporter LysO family protein [Orenia metallireducens]PRX31125.1 lysine exporter LysO-like protein [Orenia metallireducens]SNY27448.1 Membrane protein of unknown function [Orenia metallireducens]